LREAGKGVVLNVEVGTLCPFPFADPFVSVGTSMKEFLSCGGIVKSGVSVGSLKNLSLKSNGRWLFPQ